MKVETIVNALDENSYVLYEGQAAWIIDPGSNVNALFNVIARQSLIIEAVLLTHGHCDHISGLSAVLKRFRCPVWIHELDQPMLYDATLNLSKHLGGLVKISEEADVRTWPTETVLKLGTSELTVIETPGHTLGGVAYYMDALLFSGDTLFKENVGRTDFPKGSTPVLRASVKRLIESFPSHTMVYPGHGPTTTLKHEKQYNPYYR